MFLSIIIPAYNEANIIEETLEKIDKYLQVKKVPAEVIVVNDGSTDSTLEKVSQIKIKNVSLISYEKNLGKGAAVKKGMLAANGELLLFMDADFSTSIEELDKFLKKIKEGYDIIIGSRALKESKIIKSQSIIKIILGKLGNKVIRTLAVPGIKDTQCGFKLFSKKTRVLFEKQLLNGWGFDFEILFLAKEYQFQVLELPVVWKNDSSSKVNLIAYPKTLLELIKIRINNLTGKYEKH